MEEVPRLSPTTAKKILNRSPLHAYHGHRLLGGGDDDKPSKAKDTGKILEALIYNASTDDFVVLDFPNFKKKEAQDSRDAVYEAGKVPVLEEDWGRFQVSANLIKQNLIDQGVVFNGGEYQKKIEWTCDLTGANCKGYLDYYKDGIIWDLKTCQDAGHAAVWRSITNFGYDVQYAAYTDGIESLDPSLLGRSRFIFAFCEVDAPYAVQLYELSERKKDIGRNKWHEAKRQWVNCLESGIWPSYFSGIGIIDAKPWETDFMEQIEIKEEE